MHAANDSSITFPVMGTTAQVSLIEPAPELLRLARDRLADLEARWSRFLPSSEISRLNRGSGAPTVVSTETYPLISKAIDGWSQTDGCFDPTVGSTMLACGYDRSLSELDRQAPVDPERYRPSPGAADIELDPYAGAVRLPPGVQLDLGGVAKGEAADLVAAELLAAGAPGCLVNVGGDIKAEGRAPSAHGWQITIDCRGADRDLTVGIDRGAVCTSTTTKRRWGGGTNVEHHLRNPASGGPLETGLTTVAIIAAGAAQAEVLTKLIFSRGPLGAAEIARRFEVTGAVVTDCGELMMLPGLAPFLAAWRAAPV